MATTPNPYPYLSVLGLRGRVIVAMQCDTCQEPLLQAEARFCSYQCGVRMTPPPRLSCTICSSPIATRRRWLSPRAVTCSTDCSIIHQANLNRDLNRRYQRERRARRRTLNEQALLKSSASP